MFIRDAQINSQLASASSKSRTDSNGDDSPSIVAPEDATLCHQMTAKGFLKSRNTLHVEEKERKKQKKVSNNANGDVIDLTSVATHNDMKRAEAATQHAEAASLQAVSSMYHTQLDALERAKNMGIPEEDLRPFILHTLTNLYSSSDSAMKKLGHRVISREEDPEVTFVNVRKSLNMKTQSDDEVVEVESDDSCDCASGYMCLNKKVKIVDSDPKCDICDKHGHSLCLSTDDVRTACFKCFGEDDGE